MYSIYAGDELLYSDVYPLETRKVTSPTLKMGVDEAGSLEFTVSEVNKCYTKLLRMKTILTVKKLNAKTGAEEAIWDGRILREDRDFYKNKKIYAEGALAFLNDSTQPIKEYKGNSLQELVTAILNEHNRILNDTTRYLYWGGKVDSFNPPELEYWATGYEYTIDAIKNLAEYLECHYIVKKNTSNGHNELWFFKDDCGFSDQSIVFAKNLMDYTENYDLSKMATVLLPLCQTDRESADPPRATGTDVDLATYKPYDDDDHYGVLLPLTPNCVCKKYLKDDVHSGDPIPPYRNKLNVLAEYIEESWRFKNADVIGMEVEPGVWKISGYVKIWVYTHEESFVHERGGQDTYTLLEAQDAVISSVPITDTNVDFATVPAIWNKTPDVQAPVQSVYNGYLDSYHTDGGSVRTYSQRAKVDFQNIVDEYGILTSVVGPRCAIVEIDYDKVKTLYFTATHWSGFNENYRSISIWKKSISFDESTTFVDRIRDRRASSTEGYLYPAGNSQYSTMTYNNRFYPAYGYSIGYKMDPSVTQNYKFTDLVEDTVPKVLNPNKYTFVKEFDILDCYERRIDLELDLNAETDSKHVLIVLSGGNGPFNLTLITPEDDAKDSTITIGQDPDGIDLTKTHYIRYYQENHYQWRQPAEGEEHDDHFYANDIYDATKGYGVLTTVTDGWMIMPKSSVDQVERPNLNVFNDGIFNNNDPNKIVVMNNEDTNYNCCVFVTRASYEDSNGKKHPNSIYVSTSMKGRSGIYAIFELTDGNGNDGIWDVNSGDKPQNLRNLKEIEYGKYVSGYTTYDGKKITMPYSKSQTRLMLVVVSSYNSSPKIWIHDPNQANKMQYLTIAASNNGDPKLKSDGSNIFGSGLELGTFDQNGSKSLTPTNLRVRTKDPINVKTDGSYMLTFENGDPNTKLYADVYIYGKIDGCLGHTGFMEADPYIFLPYLYSGYQLNVVFRRRVNASYEDLMLSTSLIKNPMIWRENESRTMLFTQGPLEAVTDPITEYVEITSDDQAQDADYYISTADYYTVNKDDCKLKISITMDTATSPNTVTVNGTTYMVESRTNYISYWQQDPTIITFDTGESPTYEKRMVYKSYSESSIVYEGTVFTISAKANTRYKFYLTSTVDYVDENNVTQTVDIEVEPKHVRTFSIVPYTDNHKAYSPPNRAYETYGHIEKRIEFEDVESSQELLERAQKYLRRSQFDEMQLKVKALDMTLMGAQVDNLHVGDKINVSSPPHGLYRDFVIREMSIPFDKPENTTFELGWDNKDSLAKLIRKEKSKW